MKVFCNNTDAAYRVDFSLSDGLYLRATVHGDEDLGTAGIQLESHSSYILLLSTGNKYLVRNENNEVLRSQVKLVQANKITYGSRMGYEEVENSYHAQAILQVDTNTVSGDVVELQTSLFRVAKDNITFSLPEGMEVEYENFTAEDIFLKGSKRHSFWDTYALEIDGVEHKFSERCENLGGTDTAVSMGDREYVDCAIRKYSTGFGEALRRDADNETVLVETTAGIANTRRVALANGIGSFRWYNLGFTGSFRVKLGWRWYSGIADVKLEAK